MDESTLEQLELLVVDAIDEYERVGPLVLAPDLVAQRRWLHERLQERHPPRRAVRLHALAAQLSGILSVIALDMRLFPVARAYATEATQLAELIGEPDLVAWIRGTQSLIEYYAGDYEASLAYARKGLKISPQGPQRIRLTVNGEARALARMKDSAGVDRCIDGAMEIHSETVKSNEVSASLTFGPYCTARICGNAATAYLILGRPDRVLEFGARALAVFDPLSVQGPRALTRLDMATALIRTAVPDPYRAARLVNDALDLDSVSHFASVVQRAAEFAEAATPHQGIPAIREVIQRTTELTVKIAANQLEGVRDESD